MKKSREFEVYNVATDKAVEHCGHSKYRAKTRTAYWCLKCGPGTHKFRPVRGQVAPEAAPTPEKSDLSHPERFIGSGALTHFPTGTALLLRDFMEKGTTTTPVWVGVDPAAQDSEETVTRVRFENRTIVEPVNVDYKDVEERIIAAIRAKADGIVLAQIEALLRPDDEKPLKRFLVQKSRNVGFTYSYAVNHAIVAGYLINQLYGDRTDFYTYLSRWLFADRASCKEWWLLRTYGGHHAV